MLTLVFSRSRAALRFLCQRKFPELLDVSLEASAVEDQKMISSVIGGWDPSYIAQACPLIATTLLGPWAINARAACEMAADSEDRRPLCLEMLKLVLGKIGTYWQIGASVLGKSSDNVRFVPTRIQNLTFSPEVVQLVEAHRSITELVNSRQNDLHQLPLLLPKND